MGDIADMMLDGTLCEGCGVYLEGEARGYPRYCSSCKRERLATAYGAGFPKKCKHCGKKLVSSQSEHDHMKAKHNG